MGRAVLGLLITLGLLFLVREAPWSGPGCRAGLRAHTWFFLAQLSLAIDQYEKRQGAYPEGDGQGSRSLARVLQIRQDGRPSCFEFSPGDLIEGHIANPLGLDAPWSRRIVHYRLHPPGSKPPYSLWVLDEEGKELREPGRP